MALKAQVQGVPAPPEWRMYQEALRTLSPDALEAWAVFGQLSPCRPMGMAAGGLPPSEILAWFILRDREIDPWLVIQLEVLDRVFLEYQAKKARKSG